MNSDVRYEYKKIRISNLRIPYEYQRKFQVAWSRQIARDFNPLYMNPIKVSYRDGVYWVIDGMHRMGALKILNDDADVEVECKVYFGLTKEDEAMLFATQYDNSHRVASGYQMRAKYVGGDQEIAALKFAVKAAGLTLGLEGGKAKNRICCCGYMLKMYRSCGSITELVEFLKIIKEIWDGEAESLRKEIIGGMWIFYKTYESEIDAKKIVEKFSKVSPVEIYRNGKLYKNYSGDRKYAFELTNIYNKGQRVKLDPSKLQ